MAESIRTFTPDDAERAANLYQKIFRKFESPAPDSLIKYFRTLYFDHPWRRQDMPSLVLESDGGKISGFLGVLPLRMKDGGKELWAGIGGNYMVDPALKNPLAGPRLLKKFISGPQALSMSDTGNDIGRTMWEGLGGSVSYLHSIHWIKPLRPARLAVAAVGEGTPVRSVVSGILNPGAVLADALSALVPGNPLRLPPAEGTVREIGVSEILDFIRAGSERSMLAPDYTPDALGWILANAREKRQFGSLRSVGFYGANNRPIGWCLYYPNPGKIGQVLHLGTCTRLYGAVLDHVFRDAYAMNSAALIGRLDPPALKELTSRFCALFHRSNYFVLHARDKNLVDAVRSGDAWLTRLEGEWWTRLQGDSFA